MPLAVSESNLVRSIVLESFQDFVRELWDEVVPEKLIWNWHMTVICVELQRLAERVFKGLAKEHDLIINVPPGTTKSTIASVMFPAWTMARMPSARSICGSHAASLSLDLSRKSRDVIQSETYMRLFPEIELRADQNTKSHFINNHGGGRYSCGTGGSVIGHHAHFIIVDDPLDPQEALSEVELRTCNDWMDTTLPTRKVDKAVTPTILIMQRLHQNDPTGHMLDKKAGPIRQICLPGDCYEYDVKPRHLKRFYINGLLDPTRMSRKVMHEAYKTLGAYGYAGQYGQQPAPPGGGIIKPGRITVDAMPAPTRFIKVCRYWDKASTPDGGKYTVGALLGWDVNQLFWIMHIVRGQWGPDERESNIKQTCQQDVEIFGRFLMVFGFEEEPGSSGKVDFMHTKKNLPGFRVKPDKVTGDKVVRALPFADEVNSHNFSMVPGDWNRPLIDEMLVWPKGTYVDQVDACAGAYNMMTGSTTRVGAL